MNIQPPKLRFNNPIGEAKLDEIINLLHIASNDMIVDIGGGNGEILLKMLQKNQARGILIDLNEKLVADCRKKSQVLIESGRLTLIVEDAKAYLARLELQSVDCFVCIGSSYALGGYTNFITAVIPYLKPGGFLLIGEEFWAKKPSQEYLDILGGTESESRYHYENMELAEKLGLTYLYSHIASQDEWNTFEGVYFLEEELKAVKLPEDKKQAHLERIRAFRRAQFKYGRSMMGFGVYLFTKQ